MSRVSKQVKLIIKTLHLILKSAQCHPWSEYCFQNTRGNKLLDFCDQTTHLRRIKSRDSPLSSFWFDPLLCGARPA